MVGGNHLSDLAGLIATVMPHHDIVIGPLPLVDRHRKEQEATILKDPAQFSKRLLVVADMLNHIKGADQIEFLIGEWQGVDVANPGQPTCLLQTVHCSLTEVDEPGADYR